MRTAIDISKRLLLLFILLQLVSCTHEYSPKPKAYPRVVFPERKYELFQPQGCPYQFDKPLYSVAIEDSSYFERNMNGACWYNIEFPNFNGTLNLTYKPLSKDQKLDQLVEDAHKLSFKHSKKADYIDEVQILNPNGVRGLLYEVGGDAASNVQFYLTDSVHHFVRGALYFNNTPNADSMRPVVDFVKEDLRYMLKTFQWK